MTPEQVSAVWLARFASANTRAAYESDVRQFLAWCADRGAAPWETTTQSLTQYLAIREAAGAGTASISRQLAALRGYFAVAEAAGLCDANPFEQRRAAATASSPTNVLSHGELQRLHLACDGEPRTALLVHLLAGHGLRLAEVLSIDHEHLSGATAALRLRLAARVEERSLTLSPEVGPVVRTLQRGSPRRGPLLVAKRGAAGAPTRLTRFGADLLIKQAAQGAGIRRTVSANVLRRTHAAMAHRAGDHVDDIRDRMGQRDVRTTRRYLLPTRNPTT
jgi:integrase/recombinase XerD